MITIVLPIAAVLVLVAIIEGLGYLGEKLDARKSAAGHSSESPLEEPKSEPRHGRHGHGIDLRGVHILAHGQHRRR